MKPLYQLMALGLLAACAPTPTTTATTSSAAPSASAAPPPTTTNTSTGNGMMKPREQIPFTRGPSVTPAKDLAAWLDKQVTAKGEPRLIRLPVIVKTSDRGPGFTGRGARVGNSADALTIDVNDSMLGVALADRARTACPKATTCALWLDGYWRGKNARGAYAFDVKYVVDPIAPEALAKATYAEVGDGDVGAAKQP